MKKSAIMSNNYRMKSTLLLAGCLCLVNMIDLYCINDCLAVNFSKFILSNHNIITMEISYLSILNSLIPAYLLFEGVVGCLLEE